MFRVTRLEEVDLIRTDELTPQPMRPSTGAKLIRADIVYKNNTSVPVDVFCGGGSSVLLDADQRNFQPKDGYIDIAGNDVCGNEIQPGFKSNVTLGFEMPDDAQIGGLVLWNGSDESDSTGEASNVVFTP